MSKRNYWLGVFLVGAVAIGGCAPMMAYFATLFPPPAEPAVYDFPKEQTVLVFVDDRDYPVSFAPVKYKLTETLNRLLEENKIVEKTIPYATLMRQMASDSNFHSRSITEIGTNAGADIVLYVKVDRFSLKDHPASPVWNGFFKTSIRVVSVEEGRLWPNDEPEYAIAPVRTHPQENMTPTYGEKLAKEMAKTMADKIGILFFEHPGKEHEELPEPELEGGY